MAFLLAGKKNTADLLAGCIIISFGNNQNA